LVLADLGRGLASSSALQISAAGWPLAAQAARVARRLLIFDGLRRLVVLAAFSSVRPLAVGRGCP
jgi:hypothetical protein